MPEFQLDTAGSVHVVGKIDSQGVLQEGEPNGGAVIAFADLDAFTQGYIEALFFTDNEPGMTREDRTTPEWQERVREGQAHEIPGDYGFDDLAPDTLRDIMRDCFEFQEQAKEQLKRAYDCPAPDDPGFDELRTNPDYEAAQAGRDLWFTRNGHGVGFWDRGLGQVGDDLSTLARRIGQTDSYIGDDGLVYLS